MIRLEVRNMPAPPLLRALVDELGATQDADSAHGDGWRVRFIEGEPVRTKLLTIPVLFIEIDGVREDEAAAFLRRKTMRGGG